MSYSGVQPIFGTFPSDLFTANGSNTIFTLSSVPGNDAALLVTIDGVRQHTDTYSYSANTLTFSEAPPSGAIIETVNMGSRADVIITDGVYRKTQFTATAAQTNFNISTGYTVGFVDVYLNGIRLVVADDFTANDGSMIILAVAAAAGDAVEVVAYGTFNVANALQKSGDTMSGNLVVSGTTTLMSPVAIANTTGNTVVFANTGAVTFGSSIAVTGVVTANAVLRIGNNSSSDGYSGGVYLNRGSSVYNFFQASDGTNDVILGLDNTISYAKIGTVSSMPIGLITGNAPRLSIDTSGRVTTPYQPSFMAVNTVGMTVGTSPTKITGFNTALYNNGGGWDAANQRFTAAVTGYYYVAAQMLPPPNVVQQMWFYKNGATYSGNAWAYSSGSTRLTLSLSYIMYMVAGDYVEVWGQAGSSSSWDNSGYFTGRLLG